MRLVPDIAWTTAEREPRRLDPRLLALLREIRRHSTLRAAVAGVGLSYRGAWDLLGTEARALGAPLVVLHKRRESGTHTVVTHLVGDVRDRSCVIVDDIISTGGTIAESAAALLEAGAKSGVAVCATHALLLNGAIERMRSAGVRATFVTDSVPVRNDGTDLVYIVSTTALFATALRRIRADGSLRELRGSRDSGLGTRDS